MNKCLFSCVVGLEPVPAARPRVTMKGWSYYPKRYTDFKKALGEELKRLVLGSLKEPLTGPLIVSVTVMAARPKTTKLSHPKPDIDNYAKAVFDAANEVVWVDDSQIVRTTAEKAWAQPEDGPSIELLVYRADQ